MTELQQVFLLMILIQKEIHSSPNSKSTNKWKSSLNANGTFSYTHDGSATTTDVFYYRPTDGLFPGNTTTVTIYINNPALGVGDTVFVMESGTATLTSAGATSVLDNDTDPDGDALTAVKLTNPSRGTVTLNADGHFFIPIMVATNRQTLLPTVLMTVKLIVYQLRKYKRNWHQ